MGVRKLKEWINWIVPEAKQSPNWDDLSGKCVAVDIMNIIFDVKGIKIPLLPYIALFISELKKLNISPVFVFDGPPPDIKKSITTKRQEKTFAAKALIDKGETKINLNTYRDSIVVDRNDRQNVKKLCYACGIPFINAKHEADDVLANLSKTGEVYAVISSDMDMLARGVKLLISPDIMYRQILYPGESFGWIEYDLTLILKKSRLNESQFTKMCVLMGCDYTEGCISINYHSAYMMAKRFDNIIDMLNLVKITNYLPYIKAYNQLTYSDTLDNLSYSCDVFEKWKIGE